MIKRSIVFFSVGAHLLDSRTFQIVTLSDGTNTIFPETIHTKISFHGGYGPTVRSAASQSSFFSVQFFFAILFVCFPFFIHDEDYELYETQAIEKELKTV